MEISWTDSHSAEIQTLRKVGQFWNVVVETDGDQLDRLYEHLSITKPQGEEEHPTNNKKKAN